VSSPEDMLANARWENACAAQIVNILIRVDTAAPAMTETQLRNCVSELADLARRKCPQWAHG